jgi:hypothetical protein
VNGKHCPEYGIPKNVERQIVDEGQFSSSVRSSRVSDNSATWKIRAFDILRVSTQNIARNHAHITSNNPLHNITNSHKGRSLSVAALLARGQTNISNIAYARSPPPLPNAPTTPTQQTQASPSNQFNSI